VYYTTIPAGVIVASNRGYNGSSGGLIFRHFDTTNDPTPATMWSANESMLTVGGDGVRITGLRIEGTNSSWVNNIDNTSMSVGILNDKQKGLVVDNNEIYGWTVGVQSQSYTVTHQAEAMVSEEIGSTISNIHHNYIHNIWGNDMGYGVAVYEYSSLVKGNVFDKTRHSIAAGGGHDSGLVESYEFSYNIQLSNATSHPVDVHGQPDHHDAGVLYRIHHNTLLQNFSHAIVIRGIPVNDTSVYFNAYKNCNNDCYGDSTNGLLQYYNASAFLSGRTNLTVWNNVIQGIYTPSDSVGVIYT
jgi:hypothetical protein